MDMYDKHDMNRIKNVKEDIDNLLVFSGLFSAVLSAFVVETYRGLQVDPSETTNQILLQLSSQLASLHVSNTFINSTRPAFITPTQTFVPQRSSVVINTLWFFSLVISLIAASLGILVKQWLNEFMTQEVQNPKHRVRVRFFRSDGLDKWQVFKLAAALPILLQIALFLFFIGLNIFLREINPVVGWTTSAPFFGWLLAFVITTVAPALSSQCPYKNAILDRLTRSIRPKTHKPIDSMYRVCRALVSHSLQVGSSVGQSLLPAGSCLSQVELLSGRYVLVIIPYRSLIAKGLSAVVSHIGDYASYIWCGIDLVARILHDELYKYHGYKPHPDEDTVGQSCRSDLDIILRSDFLFRDEHIRRTLTECTEELSVIDITKYYDGIEKKLKKREGQDSQQSDPESSQFEADPWSTVLDLPIMSIAEDVVQDILVYRSANPGRDTSWFDTLTSIVKQGPAATWGNHLPIFLVQLIRSDSDQGASHALLAVLASYYFASKNNGVANSVDLLDFSQNLSPTQVHGDLLYLENLIQITTTVFDVFWEQPKPSTTAVYGYVLLLREKFGVESKKDEPQKDGPKNDGPKNDEPKWNPVEVGRSVALPFLRSLSSLLLLVSPGVPNTPLENLRYYIGTVWDSLPKEHWELLPAQSSLIDLIHTGICGRSKVPFQALFSLASQGSFGHFEMYTGSLRQEASTQYLDNLVMSARSEIDNIRTFDASASADDNARTEQNLIAVCYTFSVLLNISSKIAITNRKESLHELTSEIFTLLDRDSTKLIETATRTTFWHLLWCEFPKISDKCEEAISENLLKKLGQLCSSVSEKFEKDETNQ